MLHKFIVELACRDFIRKQSTKKIVLAPGEHSPFLHKKKKD